MRSDCFEGHVCRSYKKIELDVFTTIDSNFSRRTNMLIIGGLFNVVILHTL